MTLQTINIFLIILSICYIIQLAVVNNDQLGGSTTATGNTISKLSSPQYQPVHTSQQEFNPCSHESIIRFYWLEKNVLLGYQANKECDIVSCHIEFNEKNVILKNCYHDIIYVTKYINSKTSNKLIYHHSYRTKAGSNVRSAITIYMFHTKNILNVQFEYDFSTNKTILRLECIYYDRSTCSIVFYAVQNSFYEPISLIEFTSSSKIFEIPLEQKAGIVYLFANKDTVPEFHLITNMNVNIFHYMDGYYFFVDTFQGFYMQCKDIELYEKLPDAAPTKLTYELDETKFDQCLGSVNNPVGHKKARTLLVKGHLDITPCGFIYVTELVPQPYSIANIVKKDKQYLRYDPKQSAPFGHIQIVDNGKYLYGNRGQNIPIKKRLTPDEPMPKVYGIIIYSNNHLKKRLF